jgi:hypothetical protein
MVDTGEHPVAMLIADGTSPMLAAMQVDETTGTWTRRPATMPPRVRRRQRRGDRYPR